MLRNESEKITTCAPVKSFRVLTSFVVESSTEAFGSGSDDRSASSNSMAPVDRHNKISRVLYTCGWCWSCIKPGFFNPVDFISTNDAIRCEILISLQAVLNSCCIWTKTFHEIVHFSWKIWASDATFSPSQPSACGALAPARTCRRSPSSSRGGSPRCAAAVRTTPASCSRSRCALTNTSPSTSCNRQLQHSCQLQRRTRYQHHYSSTEHSHAFFDFTSDWKWKK